MSTSQRKSSVYGIATLLLILLSVSSCAKPSVVRHTPRPAPQAPTPGMAETPESAPPPAQTPAPAPQDRVPEPRQETPRTVASLRLTEQARSLLESGNPDQAIRTLERAMNLSPSNGENFFYLSQAWLMKGNLRQAEEFNRLAVLHLKRDANWMARVAEQAERIRAARGSKK